MTESELKKEFGKTISQIIIKRNLNQLVVLNKLTRDDVKMIQRSPLRRHYHFGNRNNVMIPLKTHEYMDVCKEHPACVVMDVNQETKRTIIS